MDRRKIMSVCAAAAAMLAGCGVTEVQTADEGELIRVELNGGGAECASPQVSSSDSNVIISGAGEYTLSGQLDGGMVIVDCSETDKVRLTLENVRIDGNSAAVYVKGAESVTVALADGSANILSSKGEYASLDDNNIDAAVFSKSDISFEGTGSLTVSAAAGNGIVSKDGLVFSEGTYEIEAAEKGLSAKDSISAAGGIYNINAQDDTVNSDVNIDISGGDFTLCSGDDALHADGAVNIAGGNITVSQCEEGIEGQSVAISGGNISLTTKDDGINAAGADGDSENIFAVDENAFVNISGGVVSISCSGDGIDSNGSISVSGGEVYICGPDNGGNCFMDYASEAIISGGVFAAAGSSQMAQNFSQNSVQCAMLVNTNSQQGGEMRLSGSDGSSIFDWAADINFDCVLISTPDIAVGESYTLTVNGSEQTVEMTEKIIGGKMGFGGGFKGGPAGNRGQMPEGMERPEGFERPEGMEPPEGFELPEGMERPEGLERPEEMEPPIGFEVPEGGEAPLQTRDYS